MSFRNLSAIYFEQNPCVFACFTCFLKKRKKFLNFSQKYSTDFAQAALYSQKRSNEGFRFMYFLPVYCWQKTAERRSFVVPIQVVIEQKIFLKIMQPFPIPARYINRRGATRSFRFMYFLPVYCWQKAAERRPSVVPANYFSFEYSLSDLQPALHLAHGGERRKMRVAGIACAEDHTVALNARHHLGREVCDHDDGFADQIVRSETALNWCMSFLVTPRRPF